MNDNCSIAYSVRQGMGTLTGVEHVQVLFPAMFSSMFPEQRYAQKDKDDKFIQKDFSIKIIF